MEKTRNPAALLSTKLTPPQLRPPIVLREAMFSRLDLGIDQKLTLISAPAGFGKTTLVCEWIASRREQEDLLPTAWVSLDPEDNDPVRFWRYVLTACQAFDSQVSDPFLAFLSVPGPPPLESVITAFINEAAGFPANGCSLSKIIMSSHPRKSMKAWLSDSIICRVPCIRF